MQVMTLNNAKRNLENLIRQVMNNMEPTIICSDDGEKAVLVSLDEYNSWQETLYLLSTPANAEHLRKSIAQVYEGRVTERELIEL